MSMMTLTDTAKAATPTRSVAAIPPLKKYMRLDKINAANIRNAAQKQLDEYTKILTEPTLILILCVSRNTDTRKKRSINKPFLCCKNFDSAISTLLKPFFF